MLRSALRTLLVAIPMLLALFAENAPAAQDIGGHPRTSAPEAEISRQLSICQAQAAVLGSLQQMGPDRYFLKHTLSDVHVLADRIEFYAEVRWPNNKPLPSGRYVVDLTHLGTVSIGQWYGPDIYSLRIDGLSPLIDESSRYILRYRPNPSILAVLSWRDGAEAQAFADELNLLSTHGHDIAGTPDLFTTPCDAAWGKAWNEFQRRAAPWRTLTPKPPVGEKIRAQRILAENALKEHRLDVAAEHYEAATEMDPCWPEGHFNAALVSAELQDFSAAVWHMRCYLELVPDAPDVQQARDQIVIWQDKVVRQPPVALPDDDLKPRKGK